MFFTEWSGAVIINPFEITKEWFKFRSCDWGCATPFSFNWWAVVGDDYQHNGRVLPRGALVNYREWYGSSAPNVGLRLTAEDVAHGIKYRERNDGVKAGVHHQLPAIARVPPLRRVCRKPRCEAFQSRP
jgi:hypothetical protein